MLRTKENEWTICEWSDKLENRPGVKYLAGQECAHRMLDKFLSTPKLLTREGTAPEQPTEEKTENKENAE